MDYFVQSGKPLWGFTESSVDMTLLSLMGGCTRVSFVVVVVVMRRVAVLAGCCCCSSSCVLFPGDKSGRSVVRPMKALNPVTPCP